MAAGTSDWFWGVDSPLLQGGDRAVTGHDPMIGRVNKALPGRCTPLVLLVAPRGPPLIRVHFPKGTAVRFAIVRHQTGRCLSAIRLMPQITVVPGTSLLGIEDVSFCGAKTGIYWSRPRPCQLREYSVSGTDGILRACSPSPRNILCIILVLCINPVT